jgi:hypothetical protein
MRFVSPHQSVMFAPVTGTVDADFDPDWLTDGRPTMPVQKTGGSISLTVTPAAALNVDVIAVCQHAIRAAAAITLGGSLSSTIATAAYPPDSIPVNWFRKLSSPVSTSSIVLGVTGNTDPVIIGELYAGLSFEIASDLETGRTFDPGAPFSWEGYAVQPPYDSGFSSPRRMRGQLQPTDAEYASLVACYQAVRRGTRPALVIPNDAVNDAWLSVFQWTESLVGGSHIVTIEIVEIPRVRW